MKGEGGSMEIIWNPRTIEQKSMEIIETYIQGYQFDQAEKSVVKRIIHTTGDPSIVSAVEFSPGAGELGRKLLRNNPVIFTDVSMIKAGINAGKLNDFGGRAYCSIAAPETAEAARQWNITRAAAAMRLWGKRLDNAIIAIGNAPTALFEVIAMIEKGLIKPALIIGTPVGFVGAAESKELMVQKKLTPYITIHGTRGGSPIAASIINALLYLEK